MKKIAYPENFRVSDLGWFNSKFYFLINPSNSFDAGVLL